MYIVFSGFHQLFLLVRFFTVGSKLFRDNFIFIFYPICSYSSLGCTLGLLVLIDCSRKLFCVPKLFLKGRRYGPKCFNKVICACH